MANLLNYDGTQLLGFVLILIRVGSIVSTAPIFGDSNVPGQIKVAIALVLSVSLYPVVPAFALPSTNVSIYLLLVAGEMLIGLILGMVGQVLFASVRIAGELTGMQMGLSMANVVDPQSQTQVSQIAQFQYTLAALLFLGMDAHHVVIQAMVHSYELLPPGQVQFGAPLIEEIISLTAGMFTLGLQLGAPLVISLFVANLIMGFIARSVPQMNIFAVGFPFTIMLGFVLLLLGMPFFVQAVRILLEKFDDQVVKILILLQ